MTRTCARTQALIETASFMRWPPDDLAAAERHARTCDACGSIVSSQTRLESDLRTLSTPLEVRDLSADVMTRIAAAESAQQHVQPERGLEAGWWLRAAVAVAVAVAIALWSPVWLGSWTTQVPVFTRLGSRTHGVPQAAFALVSILLYVLYVAVLFDTSGSRQTRRT